MTSTMDQINRIKELYFWQGRNITEIASELKLNRKTVKKYIGKYIEQDDFNVSPQKLLKTSQSNKESKLDIYKFLINSWLEDLIGYRKQKHTATQIYKRLCDEIPGFDCSRRTVSSYVKEQKRVLKQGRLPGYVPLIHRLSEAQADFGTADFYENGRFHSKVKYFVLSFPYSNGAYFQLNYGENLECLMKAMVNIFEHIGGVPPEIWFDNATTMVTKVINGGGRRTTERFTRFAQHYRFKPVFMNPASGWEKGNVENKVGYIRNNLLVPTPRFKSLSEFNEKAFNMCEKDM